MEDDSTLGRERPGRSRRLLGAVTTTCEQQAREPEPPADQPSLLSLPGATAAAAAPLVMPGDQAFDTLEDTSEKKTVLGPGLPPADLSQKMPEGASSPYANKATQRPAAAEMGVIEAHNATVAAPGAERKSPAMFYEDSAVRVPPLHQHQHQQQQPGSFPSLPANTTDDAKLVDHYEHRMGISASLGSSQERSQLLFHRRRLSTPDSSSLCHQAQTDNTDERTTEQASPLDTGQGLEQTAGRAAASLKPAPLELGCLPQLADLSATKQMPAEHSESATVSQSADLTAATSVKPKQVHRRPECSSESSAQGACSATPSGPRMDAEVVPPQPAQILKDILANVVLEEQVITIKLHRDLPPRRNRRHEISRRTHAAPATNTHRATPPEPLAEDQITHAGVNGAWPRPSTLRAISNIETLQDREAFFDDIDTLPSSSPPDGGAGPSGVHWGPAISVLTGAPSGGGSFAQEGLPSAAGPSQQRKPPSKSKAASSSRPNSAARVERVSNAVIYRTGRRSAPVFSRRGFGTTEFWNCGQTSINRAILRELFSRPSSSGSTARSRSEVRGAFGRERSLSAGAERKPRRGKRGYGPELVEKKLLTGRASAPAESGKSGKTKKAGKKFANYGSLEENSERSSIEYRDSTRLLIDSDGEADPEDPVIDQVFRDGEVQPRVHGPGIKGGFRSHRKTPQRTLLVDPGYRRWSSDEAGAAAARPLSVQDIEQVGEPVVRGDSKRPGTGDGVAGRDGGRGGDSADGSSESDSSDESSSLLKDTKTEIYRRRWYLLFLFSMMALVWNAIWSTWGPVAQSAKQVYGWDDGDIAMFIWLGNLPFLVTMFPIAYLMDVKGMRAATVLCCGLMFLGAGLRCIPCDTGTATWLIRLGQLLNGVAGTVPISGPALLSGLWFPPSQRATATAISTVMGYLGACVSFVLGPLLVKEPTLTPVNGTSGFLTPMGLPLSHILTNSTGTDEQKKGIELILYSEMAAAGVLFILVIIYFPSKPPLPPSISASVPREEYLEGLKHLVQNKQFWVTAIAYSVPIGVFEVWQVVLDVILDPKVSQQTAGWMDFYATIGGCISGLLISRFADLFTRQMKVFLLVFYFLAAASMLWFSLLVAEVLPFDLGMVYAAMVVGGVFLDGGAPLFFELVIEVSYPVGEGVTSGCLQMICAGAGVLFLSLVQIKSIGKEWMNWLFTACITLAIPLLFFIKTNYGRADIDDFEVSISSSSSSDEDEEENQDERA